MTEVTKTPAALPECRGRFALRGRPRLIHKETTMRNCVTNLSLPHNGELVSVTFKVEFEVAPADPSVGIMGNGIDEFKATVIDADIENVTVAQLANFQRYFNEREEKFRDEIDEACLESLDDGDDRGGY